MVNTLEFLSTDFRDRRSRSRKYITGLSSSYEIEKPLDETIVFASGTDPSTVTIISTVAADTKTVIDEYLNFAGQMEKVGVHNLVGINPDEREEFSISWQLVDFESEFVPFDEDFGVREETDENKKSESKGLWDLIEEFSGTIEAPEDWSIEHDYYLYGSPKRYEKKISKK